MNIIKVLDNEGKVIAYLNNVTRGNVKQVINGEYTLNFNILVEPFKTEYLHNSSNLLEYNNNLFKVNKINEIHSQDGMLLLDVYAEHESYDLLYFRREGFLQENKSALVVCNEALKHTGYRFLGTDITDTNSINIEGKTNVKYILTQIANIWRGEFFYFQRDIEFKRQIGKNRGVDFRYGKNIRDIKRINDFGEQTSYEVNIVQGSDLAELGYFELGDTVKIIDDDLNIDYSIRIIELEKDIITGLNSRVVLGKKIKDISSSLYDIDKVKEVVEETKEKINNVVDEQGKLITEKLNGSLNTAITNINNATSTIVFDAMGIKALNQPIESEATKIVNMTSEGIGIANAKNADGTWRYRTAITGDGINADEINTGTLTAINIDSVNITGSNLTLNNSLNRILMNSTDIFKLQKKVNNSWTDLIKIDTNGNLSITLSGYATTTDVNNAKTEAVNSANSSTDSKLTNYSTSAQVTTAINVSANGLQSQITSLNGNVSTINQTINGLTVSVNNSKTIFDTNGLTIKNGGFKIQNSYNVDVFGVDTSGNVTLAGNLYNTSMNKTVRLYNGKLEIGSGNSAGGNGSWFQNIIGSIYGEYYRLAPLPSEESLIIHANKSLYLKSTYYSSVGYGLGSSGHVFTGNVTLNSNIIAFGKTFTKVKQGSMLTSSDYVMVAN